MVGATARPQQNETADHRPRAVSFAPTVIAASHGGGQPKRSRITRVQLLKLFCHKDGKWMRFKTQGRERTARGQPDHGYGGHSRVLGRRQRKIYTRCRSHCVAIFTTWKRVLILSKRCEKTFGFDKKMQRSGSSPERSAKFDHSSPITFFRTEKLMPTGSSVQPSLTAK